MHTLAFVALIVVTWLIIAGVTLSILFGLTRHAIRQSRAKWPLSPKMWLVLVAGEVTQAIGVLFFALALLAVGLMLQLPIEWILKPLLVPAFLGIYLGGMVLVIWLSWVVRVRGSTTSLDALFGQDRSRTVLVLVVAVLVSGSLGYAAVTTWALPWLVGYAVAVPIAINFVCLYSLLAHTSTAVDPGTTGK